MNTSAITKHYDKLLTVERFKLLNAATLRGDDADARALATSAATKTWRITTMRGLFEAFDFLAFWHVLTMLELESLYWILILMGDDDRPVKIPGGNTWQETIDNIQRRALAHDAAWRAVCKEYNVNADEITADLPGALAVGYFIATLRDVKIDYDATPYINDLRAVIDHKRKEWE